MKNVPTQRPSDPWIEIWLSAGRFGTYLSAATVVENSHWTEIPTMLKLFPVVMKKDAVQHRLVDVNEIPRNQIQRARMVASSGWLVRPRYWVTFLSPDERLKR